MPRQQNLLFISNRPSTLASAKQTCQEYALVTASSIAEGLESLAAQQFDLVILDVRRPPEAALECLRTIRHDDPEALVVVVLPVKSHDGTGRA